MKTLAWALLLSLLAVMLAAVLRYTPGYVLVMIPPYRIELSSGLAALLALGLFAAGHLVLRAASRLAALPAEARAWRTRERRARAEAALAAALRASLAQQPGVALEQAQVAFDGGADPVASALLAAQAAHALGDTAACETWLARAGVHDADDPAARLACARRWAAPSGASDTLPLPPVEPPSPGSPSR